MKNLKFKKFLLLAAMSLFIFIGIGFNIASAASISANSNCSNLVCDFTANVIGLDPNLSVQTYGWDFGDNNAVLPSANKISHTYSKATNYNVEVVAYDNNNSLIDAVIFPIMVFSECNDGVDNDNNGLKDYPNDVFGCDSIDDNQEFSLISPNPVNKNSYTLSNPGNVSINQGKSRLITIIASKNSGPDKIVQFSASGFPSGVMNFFNPDYCGSSSSCETNLAIDVGYKAVPGVYPITVKTGNLGQTSFNLTVNEKIATPLTNETAGPSATSQSIPNPSTATYTFSVPNPLSSKTIFDLIQRVINGLIILSVPIASILIIYSGILYMTSAGTDRIKKATSALVWTIAGFGLLLISSGIIDAVKNILGVTTDKGTGATPPIVLGGPKTFQDILNIFIDLANKFFTFAIIIASVMIIVSGISFMTARDDATKAATSRKMLIYAIIGVVVAIASTFIIQVVKNYFLS